MTPFGKSLKCIIELTEKKSLFASFFVFTRRSLLACEPTHALTTERRYAKCVVWHNNCTIIVLYLMNEADITQFKE